MLAVIAGGCINALAANGSETLAEVQTICSKRPLGRSIFWECSSTVAYLDAATSEVYYCKRGPSGHHRRRGSAYHFSESRVQARIPTISRWRNPGSFGPNTGPIAGIADNSKASIPGRCCMGGQHPISRYSVLLQVPGRYRRDARQMRRSDFPVAGVVARRTRRNNFA